MQNNSNFAELNLCNNIWAIGSIHSRADSFESIKEHIMKNFDSNDKVVFLGNVIGVGDFAKETLSSVIDMRMMLMSKFYLKPEDIIFLRGAQEEMFLKLLQLQTAPNPSEILNWMYEHGVDKTVESYGLNSKEFIKVSSQGIISITKLTSKLNKILANNRGHKEYFLSLQHAAFPDTRKVLFVNRGVDITRPLSAQNDCFWWGYHNFSKINKSYTTFRKIIRGYESSIVSNFDNIQEKIVCSLYQGPLSSDNIIAGKFNDSGQILDLFESK
jgi:serine/threonine protein phosphatase 1